LFSRSPQVVELAMQYQLWVVLIPILAVASYQLDGIFAGVSHTRQMRNTMLISSAIYLALISQLSAVWGNHGLWFALAAFMLLRGLSLGFYYPNIAKTIVSAR
jgi:MATE family multidrug resistance protein